jgi:hypothetical protein
VAGSCRSSSSSAEAMKTWGLAKQPTSIWPPLAPAVGVASAAERAGLAPPSCAVVAEAIT